MKAIAAAVLALGAVAALLLFSGGDAGQRKQARRAAAELPRGRSTREVSAAPGAPPGDERPPEVVEPPRQDESEPHGHLEWLEQLGEPAFDLTEDRVRFERLFARAVKGPVVDGARWDPTKPTADGTVLRFPAGEHEWQVRTLRHAERFPRHMLVEGAGMDKTLLRITALSTDRDVENLTFRDLTVDCRNRPFLDLRGPATVRLERCRVFAFDSGAGGSTMILARWTAFLAVDSEILAGYGRSPGSGSLFRIKGMLLARLVRCTIRGPFERILAGRGRGAHVFVECAFEQLEERLRRRVEDPAVATFQACSFAWERHVPDEKRRLSDFNSDWK